MSIKFASHIWEMVWMNWFFVILSHALRNKLLHVGNINPGTGGKESIETPMYLDSELFRVHISHTNHWNTNYPIQAWKLCWASKHKVKIQKYKELKIIFLLHFYYIWYLPLYTKWKISQQLFSMWNMDSEYTIAPTWEHIHYPDKITIENPCIYVYSK